METNNQRTPCQQFWEKNKYLALSYSGKIYQEICQYLKNGQVELIEPKNMIVHTCQIPEHGVRLPWNVYLLFIQIPTDNILLY